LKQGGLSTPCSNLEPYAHFNTFCACAKEEVIISKNGKEDLVRELKRFRLIKSREESIAVYLIFNKEEMDALITAYPTSEDELLKEKGFGKIKVGKYGKDILEIFKE